MYAVAGANPMPYYVVLLALHAVNVGLVFLIVHAVTRSAALACLAAGQARYHYSATAFLAIGLAVAVSTVFGRRLAVWAHAALLVWLTVFAVFYTRTHWTIQHYNDERGRVEHVLARIDAVIRATPAGEPVVTYNAPSFEGPYIAGEASIYVMNRYRFDREVYFVDPGAVGIYGMFPGSPLAHAVLPPRATRLACPRFTLQSEAR